MRKKNKINKVYCLQLWYYPPFKVSSLKKLTSIFSSFSSTLNILSQIFYYSTYTTSLPYILELKIINSIYFLILELRLEL